MSELDFPAMADNGDRQVVRWQEVADDPTTTEHEREAAVHAYTAWSAVVHACREAHRMHNTDDTLEVGERARSASKWGEMAGEELMKATALATTHPSDTIAAAVESAKEAGNVCALTLGFIHGFITSWFERTGETP